MGRASISARNAITFPEGFPSIMATMPVPATPARKGMPNSVNFSCINPEVLYSLKDNSGWACKCCLIPMNSGAYRFANALIACIIIISIVIIRRYIDDIAGGKYAVRKIFTHLILQVLRIFPGPEMLYPHPEIRRFKRDIGSVIGKKLHQSGLGFHRFSAVIG